MVVGRSLRWLRDLSSAVMMAAMRLASVIWPVGRLMAPTRAWPPPPNRSQMAAMLARLPVGTVVQGLVPTEILVRKLDFERPTV